MQSQTPSGNVSLKPRRGRSWKRQRRIDIVARLEAAFIPDADIARHLGLTVPALHHIKTCPEYLAKRITLQTGILSQYDEKILLDDNAKQEEVQELSALALNAVRAILLDRTHPHHAKTAETMLDRDRATAKISRMEHSAAPPIHTTAQDEKNKELLLLLGARVTEEPLSPELVTVPIALPEPLDNSVAQDNAPAQDNTSLTDPKSYAEDEISTERTAVPELLTPGQRLVN
jgi:hypothetical protein